MTKEWIWKDLRFINMNFYKLKVCKLKINDKRPNGHSGTSAADVFKNFGTQEKEYSGNFLQTPECPSSMMHLFSFQTYAE